MRQSLPFTDTAPDALAVQLDCIRAMRPLDRLQKACALSNRGRRQAMEALRRRYPTAAPEEIRLRYVRLAYGEQLAADLGRWLEERCRG